MQDSPRDRQLARRPASRSASPKKHGISPEQMQSRLDELEKAKALEEKERKKAESQKKKDMQAAKKKIARAIQSTKGNVRKAHMEVSKYERQLAAVDKKKLDNQQKKAQQTAKFDEAIAKAEKAHDDIAEESLKKKLGDLGSAEAYLKHLEKMQELLENGVDINSPRQMQAHENRMRAIEDADNLNLEAELQAAQEGRLRAIAAAEEARVAAELSASHHSVTPPDKQETWHEVELLRGEVGKLRDENETLRQRLDIASGTLQMQDEKIDSLRHRLQHATQTMQLKVDRIEKLTDDVSVSAERARYLGTSPSESEEMHAATSNLSTDFHVGSQAGLSLSSAFQQEGIRSASEGDLGYSDTLNRAASSDASTIVNGAQTHYAFSGQSSMNYIPAQDSIMQQAFQNANMHSSGADEPRSRAGTKDSARTMPLSVTESVASMSNAPFGSYTNVPGLTGTEFFNMIDTNSDGMVSRAEFRNAVRSGLLTGGATHPPVVQHHQILDAYGNPIEGHSLASSSNAAPPFTSVTMAEVRHCCQRAYVDHVKRPELAHLQSFHQSPLTARGQPAAMGAIQPPALSGGSLLTPGLYRDGFSGTYPIMRQSSMPGTTVRRTTTPGARELSPEPVIHPSGGSTSVPCGYMPVVQPPARSLPVSQPGPVRSLSVERFTSGVRGRPAAFSSPSASTGTVTPRNYVASGVAAGQAHLISGHASSAGSMSVPVPHTASDGSMSVPVAHTLSASAGSMSVPVGPCALSSAGSGPSRNGRPAVRSHTPGRQISQAVSVAAPAGPARAAPHAIGFGTAGFAPGPHRASDTMLMPAAHDSSSRDSSQHGTTAIHVHEKSTPRAPGTGKKKFQEAVHKVTAQALHEYRQNHCGSVF